MARILVVDDSAVYRTSMKELLQNAGHTVVGEAVNGDEGVTKYMELFPDITTMDVMMPIKGGLEALDEILIFDPHAKVIMVSATAQQSKISQALIQGAYCFLRKPIDPEKLHRALDSIH